ncbi:hypothetical protein EAH73_10335 [Hymenobacter nivis]|uniref:Uncharacterized protein n=1 Tax=Hymenobacter nivis TaxID=1850093 RepID=A0A502GX34_9BACT|nr:hypothetical protein EAH73_10335 [Hymenobacter nivis]
MAGAPTAGGPDRWGPRPLGAPAAGGPGRWGPRPLGAPTAGGPGHAVERRERNNRPAIHGQGPGTTWYRGPTAALY